MNDARPTINLQTSQTASPGWRRYFTRQRLRLFIILSIAAHLVLGMSWGVPAYVKQKRLAAEKARLEQQHEADRKASAAALAQAKKKNLQQTAQDVTEQTRKAFEAITGDLKQTDKEKTWSAIQPKIQPAEQQLAKALGDQSMTEQDLRNMQADLNRTLIDAVNQSINNDSGDADADAFVTAVETRVVPEIVGHYKDLLNPKVAQPVRSAADSFVNSTRDETGKSIGATDVDRKTIDDSLRRVIPELDATTSEIDQAEQLAAGKNPPAADEIKKHREAAAAHLTSAAGAAEAAESALTRLAVASGKMNGGSELMDRVHATLSPLSQATVSLKLVRIALDAGNVADAEQKLTALQLQQQKIGAQWNGANEAVGRASWWAEQSSRNAVGMAGAAPIPNLINQDLTKAFQAKGLPRLTELLSGALRKRLAAAGDKIDESLIASTMGRVETILQNKVPSAKGYGDSTLHGLSEITATSQHLTGAEVERLTQSFIDAAAPIVLNGVNDVVADSSDDAHLADLVSKPDTDPTRDDVRDRVAMLEARASDGRVSGFDSVSFTDLRASALGRAANLEHARGAADDSATTLPADAPPLIDDVKKDIQAALKKELDKVLDKKLTEAQANKVWDRAAKATDNDINHLAQDLIDPNVSDSDLESRRLEFSGKFLDSVRSALDQTASDDVAGELLKQLQGQAGDAVASAYKGAVKNTVGAAVTKAWNGAAQSDRSAADQRVRDIRIALEAAKATADKAAQILDQVKDRSAQASADPAAAKQATDAGSEKVREIESAVASARTDLQTAQKDVPATATELKDRLAEIDKATDTLSKSLTDADTQGKTGDSAAFGKAVVEARQQVDQLRAAIQGAQNGTSSESDQAEAKSIKAAEVAKDDSPAGPGVKSRIEGKFDGKFRKEALPRLTKQAIGAYKQRLEQGGVAADPGDTAALEKAIAAALDKKVTGEAHVGDAALSDAEQNGFFDRAKIAKGEPSKEQVAAANNAADKAIDAGVASAVAGNVADGNIDGAVNGVQGPAPVVGELKDKVARLQGQLRGGRGGVLASSDTDTQGGDATAISALRRKWRGLLAGLGDGDGNGAGGKGKPLASLANNQSPGNGSAGQPGQGIGSGAPGAGRSGSGPRGGVVGTGYYQQFDQAKYKAVIEALKNRSIQQGQVLDRQGAAGQTSIADRDAGAVHPAEIVAPTTQASAVAKNDEPYKPSFKALQFAVIPYLNRAIVIGDNFDAWKDIPAIHLRPERAWLTDTAGLKIVDDLPVKVAWDNHGLYFMLDMIDADNKIEKAAVENFWQCDCMEVFIDTLNTKESKRGSGAGQQFWCWPFGSLTDDNAPGGESIFDRRTGFHFAGLKSGELTRFARKTDRGYELQWHVPTERVRDADLVPGKIIGFNITVETGIKMHYYWSASKVVVTSVHPDTWGDMLLGGSDGRLEFPHRLAFEQGGRPSTKLVSAFVVGEPLRIRVVDRDMNLNDQVKDKISVTVRNAVGEQAVAILEETGADTGVFEGSVRTALDIGEPVPGAIRVNEGESLAVTYIDQARANGARNAEIVSRIKAGPSVMIGQAK